MAELNMNFYSLAANCWNWFNSTLVVWSLYNCRLTSFSRLDELTQKSLFTIIVINIVQTYLAEMLWVRAGASQFRNGTPASWTCMSYNPWKRNKYNNIVLYAPKVSIIIQKISTAAHSYLSWHSNLTFFRMITLATSYMTSQKNTKIYHELHTSLNISPTHLEHISTNMIGRPKATLPVASIKITVKLIVIRTTPPKEHKHTVIIGRNLIYNRTTTLSETRYMSLIGRNLKCRQFKSRQHEVVERSGMET